MKRTPITFSELKARPFEIFNTGWFILSVGDFAKGEYNGMTISWGSFGTLWGKPFAMVVVRPQRLSVSLMRKPLRTGIRQRISTRLFSVKSLL